MGSVVLDVVLSPNSAFIKILIEAECGTVADESCEAGKFCRFVGQRDPLTWERLHV